MNKAIILFILFLFPLPVFADDPTEIDLDIREFELDGIKYVGFLEKDAQTLLQYRIDFPKLELKIGRLEDKIKNKELQIEKLTSANTTLLETKQFLITENVRMQKKIDAQNAWYNSTYLWFCVGLVAGTATTMTIMYLVK